jgi:hypothetical protein
MYEDEIIKEVWRNREAYAKRHGHSLRKIVADLKKRQQKPFSRLVDRRRSKTVTPKLSRRREPAKAK